MKQTQTQNRKKTKSHKRATTSTPPSAIRNVRGRDIIEVQVHSSSSSAQELIRIPAVIDQRFKIIKHLDSGGQGRVFIANDLALMNRKVLIKAHKYDPQVLEDLVMNQDWDEYHNKHRGQLIDEADNLMTLQQRSESRLPCLIKLVKDIQADLWLDPNTVQTEPDKLTDVYLVMQFLPGQTLKSLIKQVAAGKHPHYKLHQKEWWRMALVWMRQLASILENLHRLDKHDEGYLFCDLKPDNCMITHEDISIIDFGALEPYSSKESVSDTVFSTAGYCAPETHQEMYRQDLNDKVDIYSLGAMFWSMLSGLKASDYAIYNRSPRLLDIKDALPSHLPKSIQTILELTMAEDRDQRPNASELKKLCIKALYQC